MKTAPMKEDKVVTAQDAIALIGNGDSVCCSGFVGIGTPDVLIDALERRFVETQSPNDLTLVFAAAPGDGKEKGLNRLTHLGLVKRACRQDPSGARRRCRLRPVCRRDRRRRHRSFGGSALRAAP